MLVQPSAYLTVFNSARVVALGRIALALSLFVLSTTDPGDVGFQGEPDDVIALTYLILAVAIGLTALKCWWLDYVWQPCVLAIDIFIFVALPSLIEPDHEGYRIAALTTATFILLSVAIRWDWRIAGITALVLNLMNWVLIKLGPLFGTAAQVAFSEATNSEYVRSTYYFMLISLLIVWVGSRLPGMPHTNFRAHHSQDSAGMLGDALTFALTASHARCGLVCWQGHSDDKPEIIAAGMTIDPDPLDKWNLKELVFNWPESLFDLNRGHALWISPTGEIKAGRKTWRPPSILVETGVRRGALLPITASSGSAILILADLPAPSVDLLRYLATLCAELSTELDRNRAQDIDREEQLIGLRNELARNLHDSVLQTIAGVRYFLASLRDRDGSSQDLAIEVDRLDETLEAEGARLRATINQLRSAPPAVAKADFIKGLEDLIRSLSRQWRTDIELSWQDYKAHLSAAMYFEVQQIVREGVSNAVRHGHADRITVSLSSDEKQLRLVLADNGDGFPVGNGSVKPHMISQRVVDLGGTLAVESSEEGTALVIALPTGTNL